MSPDSKDNDFKTTTSTTDSVLRNRKLNSQQNTQANQIADKLSDSVKDNLKSKNLDESTNDDLFSFQIKINLPVCFLFSIAFLMRFWLIDYPKSIV